MNRRIGPFSLGGKTVLGFDTALDSQAFAQAKLASFITTPGRIVFPDGGSEAWLPGGVAEREGTMVVWGPLFTGEGLDELVLDGERREEALEALRHWLAARRRFPGDEVPWPAGALVAGEGGEYPPGTIFFPPVRLVKRCLEAEGAGAWFSGAQQWVHPDLAGSGGAVFTGGALLYRILAGKSPFLREGTVYLEDGELLRQDIREACFLPPAFAVPGLEEGAAALISAALAPIPKGGGSRPALEKLEELLGPPRSRTAASFVRPLGAQALAELERGRERFSRRKNLTVKTRRFALRNTALIGGIAAVLVIGALIAQSIIAGEASRPTTKGMSPLEVASAYYGAFGELDHQFMDACVINKAGKNDIEMVTNLFVMSRVRMAYEINGPRFIPPGEWLEAGSPPTENVVFGISDLSFGPLEGSPDGEKLRLRASFRLWTPESSVDEAEDPPGTEAAQSRPYPCTDDLTLVFHKGAWRISEIDRRPGQP